MKKDELDELDEQSHDRDEGRTGEPFGRIGCLFPADCVMPGEHFTSECCSTEQAEETYRQMDEE